MSEWKKTLLGDLISIKGGLSYQGKYIGNGNSYLLGMGCVSFNDKFLHSGARAYSGDCPDQYLVYPGDLVLATRQQSDNLPILGVPAIVPNDYNGKKVIAGTNLYIVRNDSDVDNRFLYWLLKSTNYSNHILACSKGTTVRMITKDAVESFEFSCPSKIEREGIANTLWDIENKIDLLHRQNKTLEQLAETLFRQWFVEESDLLPESYLEEWILFDPREKLNKEKSYQMFEMKCLSNNDMSIGDGVIRNVSSATMFRNGDTLLAKITPCLENGKTGFVMNLPDDEIAKGSTEFIVMRSKGEVSPYWIYCLARSKDFRDAAIQSMTGSSGRQRVQVDLLKSFEVKVELGKMKSFHLTVDPFFQKVKSNTKQIKTLTQLRDTLLPKLMSGEVRVK